jgi:hypothetical protein
MTYESGLLICDDSVPVVHDYRPITSGKNDSIAGSLDQAWGAHPGLMHELEDHFQNLRSEFEEKTGGLWTPLRGWAREDWDWD